VWNSFKCLVPNSVPNFERFSTSLALCIYFRLKWIPGCKHFSTSYLIRTGVCFVAEWGVNACECSVVVSRFANAGLLPCRVLIFCKFRCYQYIYCLLFTLFWLLESGALCALWSGLGAGFLNAVRIYTVRKSEVLLVQPASCKEAATKVSLGVLLELLRHPVRRFTQYFSLTA